MVFWVLLPPSTLLAQPIPAAGSLFVDGSDRAGMSFILFHLLQLWQEPFFLHLGP